jgi:hypothetical protein
LQPRDGDDWIKPLEIRCCENCASAFARGLYSFDEYASDFTTSIVDGYQDTWRECFDTMPHELAQNYLDYLETNVVSCDYQPYPAAFLFPRHIDGYIESKKKELRPKYIALVAFAKNYLDQKV